MNSKKVFITLLTVFLVLSLLPFNVSAQGKNNQGGINGFQVEGTSLLDPNGNEFIMRGINHPHSWYKEDLEVAMHAIAETGANTVRVVLSDGQQWDRDSAESVAEIIELASSLEMISVLEVHDAIGTNDIDALMTTVDYWIDIKDVLIGQEDKVIINISNEWYGSWSGEGWAEGYKKAIPALREAGLEHTLMVDAAGYGQYPQSIHEYGKEVFASDELENTMFSIHMYEYAGGNAEMVKRNIDLVLEQGLAVLVGEFGHRHADGNVDEDTILSHSEEVGTGWLAWSWHGNGGGVEYLDLAYDFAGEKLSEWGERIVFGPDGLQQTSVKASIFEAGNEYSHYVPKNKGHQRTLELYQSGKLPKHAVDNIFKNYR